MSGYLIHTPWDYSREDGTIRSADDERIQIASLTPQRDEDGHDMRDFHGSAIAAAPELLAALRKMYEEAGGFVAVRTASAAKRAIAKAEGRS